MKHNRLAAEKSPYLLQHAHNPVDWYAWGPEAFAKAKAEDKPIFLSIGYSTCHWCHVMERESFESEATAAILNEHFISIKVDREERPDIDHVYMSYVMAATGSGGWPMSVFLTPEQKPFYGGTYFPPEDRYGMPGFPTLLGSIAQSWKERRSEILESADSAVRFLGAERKASGGSLPDGKAAAKKAARDLMAGFDDQYGGFGRAPKFPRPHALTFLLRQSVRTGEKELFAAVEKTLDVMALGGIFDHLGGGFHRYSTDALWRIPHFEKMLYDQALLVQAYAEAYRATGKSLYAAVIRRTLDYVLGRMTSPKGGFYSAEDADSADPDRPGRKTEGAYYLWTPEQIKAILGGEAADICRIFGVVPEGNAIADPHHEFGGKSVLYASSPEEPAEAVLASISKLLAARSKRPAPHLDDKILTDWNALMIRAFAEASVALEEPRYLKAALKAAAFLKEKLGRDDGRWLHRYRDGEAAIPGGLSDYAFLVSAFVSLYDATFDPAWIEQARRCADAMRAHFEDGAAGGYYLTASDAELLISRPKEFYDGALPSGNSAAAEALVRLGRLSGEEVYLRSAERIFGVLGSAIENDPASSPLLVMAMDEWIGPATEVVLAVVRSGEENGLLKEVRRRYDPWRILTVKTDKDGRLEAQAAWVKGKEPLSGRPSAYVCRNRSCSRPVTDAESLKKELDFTIPYKG